VSIEIDDIADKKACELAVRKLYTALIDHHGKEEADRLLRLFPRDLNAAREQAYWHPRRTLNRALYVPPYIEPDDERLVLEYYAMEKPSKEGLAKYLARRNVSLNKETKSGRHHGMCGWHRTESRPGRHSRLHLMGQKVRPTGRRCYSTSSVYFANIKKSAWQLALLLQKYEKRNCKK
jgi:hypothetical protein